jgi:hypothetical protein
MSFNPQYHTWSQEDFAVSGAAEYSSYYNYRIENGVAKLFSQQVPYWSDGPWDTISGWSDTNGMNSLSGVQDDFSIFESTGLSGVTLGEFGNGTLMYGAASYTDVRGTVQDAAGRYVSGEFAAAVYTLTGDHAVVNTSPSEDNFKFTLQLKYRNDIPQVNETPPFYMKSGQQNPDGSTSWDVDINKFNDTRGFTGFLSQGILIDRGYDAAFVELGPVGTRLLGPGVSGYANLNMTAQEGLKEIRIAVDYPEITIIHENGQTLYAASGFTHQYNSGELPANLHPHISLGAFPSNTGAIYDEFNLNRFDAYTADPYGAEGLAGFAGITYWDEFKILYDQAITKSPSGYTAQYPEGENFYIWTDPWYTTNDSQGYIGAYVEYNAITGGTVTVTPEIKYGDDQWANYGDVSTTLIDGYGDGSIGVDLAHVPIRSGTSSPALRFRLDAYSYGGAVSEVSKIVAFSQGPKSLVNIRPTWKETALPKDIAWFMDYKAYKTLVPAMHYQDSVYLHNESGKPALAVGDTLPSEPLSSTVGATGQVYTNAVFGLNSLDGFSVGTDGIYGNTWKNYTVQEGVTGEFLGKSFEAVDPTSGVFQGSLLNKLNIYGSSEEWTGYSGEATVLLSNPGFTSTQNFTPGLTQKAIVRQYYSDNATVLNRLGSAMPDLDIGFITTGLNVVNDYSSDNRVAMFSGYMLIEKGPGVVVTVHEGASRYPYYLPGSNYREAAPFSVAAPLNQDHPETNLAVSFGVLPRPSSPYLTRSQKDSFGNYWSEKISKHRVSDFTVLSLTGNVTDLSYAGYYDEVEPRVPIQVDTTAIDVETYTGLDRSSSLFEGWFKPAGLATSETGYVEGTLFEAYTPENPSTKTKVLINSSGELRAEIPLSVGLQAYGLTGSLTGNAGYVDVGYSQDGHRIVGTGEFSTNLAPMILTSNNKSITWGAWNHIGFALDTRAMGDMTQNSNQPLYPNYSGHVLHGSRSSKLYLELNGEIVDSVDVGLSPYTGVAGVTGFQPNEIGTSNPSVETYVNSWPRIPCMYRSNNLSNTATTQAYHIEIGKDIATDFDHVRFGIRDSVCAKSTLGTLGSKSAPPQFTFGSSPKVPIPVNVESGGVSHFESAHIYRFDHLSDYVGWDEGFAPQHMLFKNTKWYSTGDSLTNFGIEPAEMFFKYEKGPKGRPAIRLGPSMVGVVPFGSFDERIYNGQETMSLMNYTLDSYVDAGLENSTTLYSGDFQNTGPGAGVALNTDITPWSTDLGQEYMRSSSNSVVRMGSFVKFNNLPTAGMIGDVFNFNELEYLSDYYDKPDGGTNLVGHDAHHDISCMYLGVSGMSSDNVLAANRSGTLVCGTRSNHKDNVTTSIKSAVGPFSGNTPIYTDVWYHVGFEAKTQSGDGYLQMLLDGVTDSIDVCTFTRSGELSPSTGVGVGYRGFLGLNAMSTAVATINNYAQRVKSHYRIGGHIPNETRETSNDSQHVFRYMDTSYSEFVIGYALTPPYNSADESSWDWNRFASKADVVLTGLGDQAFADGGISIGPIYGTGSPLSGTLHYPEVTYDSAGTQVLWGAINGGNDIEGPGFKGLSVFDDGVFTNSASYYATFSEDNSEETLGSDDSPIQIGTRVPSHGINLGVVNAKEWTTESVLTNFDLSDKNYANISNLLLGDFDVKEFSMKWNGSYYHAQTEVPQVDTKDVRFSSFNIWSPTEAQDLTAFYMHLIGGDEKEIYIQGADPHTITIQDGAPTDIDTGRYKAYYSNRDKVYESIVCRDADGNDIPYGEFPYSLVSVPYSVALSEDTILATGLTGDTLFGYNSGCPTGLFLADGHFTTVLLSPHQSIGKSVFIHYASANNKTTELNLNDSEVYNPIPIMYQRPYGEVYGEAPGTQMCEYSLVPGANATNMYNTAIWAADMSGWAQQP